MLKSYLYKNIKITTSMTTSKYCDKLAVLQKQTGGF